MEKSLIISYFLWCFAGIFGVHHVYLRRDKQAFIWWSTFGGFIFGWIRDFFRLPVYVHQANIDDQMTRTDSNHVLRTRPAILSIERCFGAVVLGSFYGILLRVLIPEDLIVNYGMLLYLIKLLVPCGVALGVYLLCNIGREVASFRAALLGAFVVAPVTLVTEDSYVLYMAVASVLSVRYYGVEYIESPRRHPSLCARFLRLGSAGVLYVAVFSCIVMFNAHVVTETGETIPLRTATYNFFHSEAWRNTSSTGWYLYEFWMKRGWDDLFKEMKRKLDTSGIGHAQEILEVNEWMSEEEITKQYRAMARKWHPDKFHSDEEKLFAQEQFMEIQRAWETISSKKARREIRNRRSQKVEL